MMTVSCTKGTNITAPKNETALINCNIAYMNNVKMSHRDLGIMLLYCSCICVISHLNNRNKPKKCKLELLLNNPRFCIKNGKYIYSKLL